MAPQRGAWVLAVVLAITASHSPAGVIVTPTLVQTVAGWDEWEFRITGYNGKDAEPPKSWLSDVNSLSGLQGSFRATAGNMLSVAALTINAIAEVESPSEPLSFVNFPSSIQVTRDSTPLGISSFSGTWYTSDRSERLRPVGYVGYQPDLSLLARIFVTQGGGVDFAGHVNTFANVGLPIQFSAGRTDPIPDDPAEVTFAASSEIVHWESWAMRNRGDVIVDATSFTISNAAASAGRTRDASMIYAKVSESDGIVFSGLDTGMLLPGQQRTAQITYDETGLLHGAVMSAKIQVEHWNDRLPLNTDASVAHVEHVYHFLKRAAGSVGDGRASLLTIPGESISPYTGLSGTSDKSTGTVATLLGGVLQSSTEHPAPKVVKMSWTDRNAVPSLLEASPRAAISDILDLSGMSLNGIAIQLSYDPHLILGSEAALALAGGIQLSALDLETGLWVPAMTLNLPDECSGCVRFTPSNNFQGAWPGPFGSSVNREDWHGHLRPLLGSTGIDTENNVVWAVLNYDGIFAVTIPQQWALTSVPEPSAWALAAIAGVLSCLLRRRHR